ncbi:MAG: carboxypeptidase regulatory-like domain-containing protein [Candidatus Rokuibacteriota bacterium]|nr:MAG: carboxypeptidase regulatory-like domain-containing protein [Candidatus Rokubacteria bacterium]
MIGHGAWARIAAVAVAIVAFALTAHAADVPFVSGGVGADERQDLLAKEKEYTLKIVVAEDKGDFLADVQVVIEASNKEHILDTTMDGPILLAKLAPGTYTVSATSDGKTQTRTVTIAAGALRQLDFRWPASTPPAAR